MIFTKNKFDLTISYRKSLIICAAVFSVYFVIMATPFLLNGARFDPNNDIFLSFYAVDFRLGFVNRVLIGGIISLFKDSLTGKDLVIMFFINISLLIIICVPLAAKAFQKGHNEKLPLLEFGSLLFLLSPFTISEFLIFWGGYDIFWIFGVFLCLLSLKNKYLRWAIPALCFLAIFNHYGFVLAFLPVIFAILVYESVRATDKAEKKALKILTALTVLVSFATFIYFAFFANKFLQMDLEELSRSILIKTGRKLNMRYLTTNYFNFTDDYEFREGGTGELTANPFVALWRMFYYYWLAYIDVDYFLHLLGVAAPLAVFSGLCWRKIAKTETDVRLKRTYILFILIQCATLPFIFTSTDPQRWFSHPIFCQFILWYWVGMREPEKLHRLDISGRKSVITAICTFGFYALLSALFYIIYNYVFLSNYCNLFGGVNHFWRYMY